MKTTAALIWILALGIAAAPAVFATSTAQADARARMMFYVA